MPRTANFEAAEALWDDPFTEHKPIAITCDTVDPDTGEPYDRCPRQIARRAAQEPLQTLDVPVQHARGRGLLADLEERRVAAPDAEHRAAAAYCANTLRTDWTALGAKSVQLEPQTVTLSVAKAPEVAEAIGTAAKLRAMWRLRGNEPDDPDSVLEKLATLEAGIE